MPLNHNCVTQSKIQCTELSVNQSAYFLQGCHRLTQIHSVPPTSPSPQICVAKATASDNSVELLSF